MLSPSFFYIDTEGQFNENVGDEGVRYIEWAHSNGYKVWPMLSNADDNNDMSFTDIHKRLSMVSGI